MAAGLAAGLHEIFWFIGLLAVAKYALNAINTAK